MNNLLNILQSICPGVKHSPLFFCADLILLFYITIQIIYRTCSGGKKRTGSLLKQPGFTQTQGRQRRSQSEDRESYGARPMSLKRSSTAGNLPGRSMSAMTPITPRQSLHSNLPTSCVRPPRYGTLL